MAPPSPPLIRKRPRKDGTVVLPPSSEPHARPSDDEPRDFRALCGAPFPILSEDEAKRYISLRRRNFQFPHYFDWQLMQDLGVKDKLMAYLTTLGLATYVRTERSGYENLTLEFYTTLALVDKKRVLTFRLLGKPYRVTYGLMNQVFGFGTATVTGKPKPYDPRPHWKSLTGLDNWHSDGIQPGFIKDAALVLCHKFVAYNVFGKEQANKISGTEVFMLYCSKTGKKMCPTTLIWHHLEATATGFTFNPSLSPIITGLAEHFGVIGPDERPPGDTPIEFKLIDMIELRPSLLVTEDRTIAPYASRRCFQKPTSSKAAKKKGSTASQSSSPSPDAESDPEDMEVEDVEDDSFLPLTRGDLLSFQTHFDTTIGDFRREVFQKLDDQDHRLAQQQERLIALETLWSTSRTTSSHPPSTSDLE